MAPEKDITKAIAYLKRFEFGAQPPAWLAPGMLAAELVETDTAEPGVRAPIRSFSHEAAVVYLVDQGEHYEWIDERDMERTGVEADTLHQIGIANLSRLVAELRLVELHGVLTLRGLGMFEASMVLCGPLWESDTFVSRYGANGAIVTMPSHDSLAICARGDDDALALLRKGQQTFASMEDRSVPLCADLYARTPDGQWLPYESQHSA